MKKGIFLAAAMLLVSFSLSAQTTAREWLTKLDKTLGDRYATYMTVATPESETLNGYFMVDGEGYYLTLGVMEVYSDGKLRYEINNERKEVTEDRVDTESVDLLTNPTHAFDFVDSEFDVSVVETLDDGVVLLLSPSSADYGITDICLTLHREAQRVVPRVVVYNYDGDVITISLSLADATQSKLPVWDKSAYRAYDIVSFL